MLKGSACLLKFFVILPIFFLFACTRPSNAHIGLSTDGYGFVKNSPHVSPPEHLTCGQKLNLPLKDPSPYTPNPLFGR